MRRHVSSLVHSATLAAATALVCSPVAAADHVVSLTHLAPTLGYTYTWISSESAVALTRPGLYVLIRTGNPLYDVNDSVESTTQVPQYHDNDLFIGTGLTQRLRALAQKYRAHANLGDTETPARSVAAASGSLTLSVAPTGSSDAIVARGTGPANVPLTITLSADIIRDMPRVLLSRTNVQTDDEGKFSVVISTAPLYLQNSLVLVSATSLPGVAEARTSFVLGQTSPAIAHPVDELPHDFKPH
jgi:hypothetical protein